MNILNYLRELGQRRKEDESQFSSNMKELEEKITRLKADLDKECDPDNVDEFIRKKAQLELTERKKAKLREPKEIDLQEINQLVSQEERRIKEKYQEEAEEKHKALLKAAKELNDVKVRSDEELSNLRSHLLGLGLTYLDVKMKEFDYRVDGIRVYENQSHLYIERHNITGNVEVRLGKVD